MRTREGLAATALLAFVVSGCGGSENAKTATERSAARTTTASTTQAEAEPPAPPKGRTIRFTATDGKRLHGTLTPGEGKRAPAVVLVHQYQGGPDQWTPWIPYLHQAGYAVLNYASRSAGELDETILARDARGAIAALRHQRDVDPDRIAILGASIGGSTAAWVAGRPPDQHLRAAIGLSPAESASFFNAGDKGTFRPRNLLLIADSGELVEAQGLRQDAGGHGVTVKESKESGHGVELVTDRTVRAAVISWLDARMH
jgi:dipeptidyl aminopeptidase/acylaminoacyl peptidase